MGRSIKIVILLLTLFNVILVFLTFYLQPVAIVVPHHNVVADIRMKMLKIIKTKRLITGTVIILSPDHFSNDQRSIYYSDRTWTFSTGTQYFDNKTGNLIVSDFKKDDNLVANDHGIFNVAADVKIVWPNAKIVPILIGQDMAFGELSDLTLKIDKYCSLDCLLISSVDFSHYLPYKLANVHDEDSIKALINMDLNDPKQIEVDSPQSIYSLINFAKFNKANYFTLYAHTNSAKLAGSPDAESTSHVFGWYQRGLFVKPQNYNVKTFTLAKKIDRNKSLNSLGPRFFYGTDEINLNPGQSFLLPNGQVLSDNVVVAGIETPLFIKMEFLPIECSKMVCSFLKGVPQPEIIVSKN